MCIDKPSSPYMVKQLIIRKAVDHINSAPRANLDGKTPYQLALAKFGPGIMKALKLKCVEPDAVTLTPGLLKK